MKAVYFGFILILIILILIPAIFSIYGDFLWFSSLGYESVFLTILYGKAGLGFLSGLVFLIFIVINIKLASRHADKKKKFSDGPFLWAAAFFALLVGLSFSNWEVVLKFLNPTSFGMADPVFGLDIGFYVFTLPFYNYIFSYAITALILTIILVTASYLYFSWNIRRIELEEDEIKRVNVSFSKFKDYATPHLSILVGLFLLTLSFDFVLLQYGLLFSGGTFFGAGYTDVNITLHVLTVLMVISAIIGLFFLANYRLKKWRMLTEGVAVFIVIVFIGFLASGAVQIFQVAPDEFNFEKPFIEKNIQFTLDAYKIDNIEEKEFPVSYKLDMNDIANNRETIDNIRLWDFRPLITTFKQLQLFRTYYDFIDVDIDRYDVNGSLKQVMISTREMNTRSLPSNARTWVNEHLVYTHGYGIVMNPVVGLTKEGLPEFYVKDIPPQSDIISLDRPEIYFGDGDYDYIVVKTTTDELDYPSGDKNIFTTYSGTDGVDLNSMSRLVYALKFGSIELLVSSSIKPESKILFNRNVEDRIRNIAPFLQYDFDPYIVAVDDKLYWIIDAYTTSDMYPYSEPVFSDFGYFNYIRNSVKVVVDAYNGDVKYYVIDKEDPVIQTYIKIFPDLFADFSDMPDEMKNHIRYPEDLFTIQKELYSTFHMKDPRVFYNKEDVWVTPFEILRGGKQEMIPYYVVMRLPGDTKEEFIMMIPFTPRGKDNMIGWMAAKSDPENYGDLVVFRFSKQELIYGPLQIEARIDQDTEISQSITLWSQAGSDVFRGNTLVIPIEDSILYVEPLFLQATEQGSVPELKRVIVAHGNQLTMQETLDKSLEVLFGRVVEKPGEEPETDAEKLEKIKDLYNKAQSALKKGDLASYQNYIDQIGELVI